MQTLLLSEATLIVWALYSEYRRDSHIKHLIPLWLWTRYISYIYDRSFIVGFSDANIYSIFFGLNHTMNDFSRKLCTPATLDFWKFIGNQAFYLGCLLYFIRNSGGSKDAPFYVNWYASASAYFLMYYFMNIYDQFMRFFQRDRSASIYNKDAFYDTTNVHEYLTYISLVLIALLVGVYSESKLIFYPSYIAWIVAQVHMVLLYFEFYLIPNKTSMSEIQSWSLKRRSSTNAAYWGIVAINSIFYSSYALFKHRYMILCGHLQGNNAGGSPLIIFALHLPTLGSSLILLLFNHQFYSNYAFVVGFAFTIIMCYIC
jgi:hypothetical protein